MESLKESYGEEKNCKNQKKFNKLLNVVGILLIFIGLSLYTYYFIIYRVNKCTTNPMHYLTEKAIEENNFIYNYTFAKVYLYMNKDDEIPATKIEFELRNK